MARALRRAREGVQRLARADRVRARTGGARRARVAGRVHRRRLPQRRRGVRRVRLGRDAGARRPEALRQPGRGAVARAAARARPRTAPLHRPRHSASAERVGRAAHLSRRLPADARGSGHQGARSRRACRSSTSRTCGCTTRARWRTGAHGSPRSTQQVRARYGETFRRAWELYLAGSEAAFAVGSAAALSDRLLAARRRRRPYWARAEMYGSATPDQSGHQIVMARCDALIVGGGPAGSTCARVLQQRRLARHRHRSRAVSARQGLRRLGHARRVPPARSRSRRLPRDGTDHPDRSRDSAPR